MAPKPEGRKIPQDEWEKRKGQILYLFQTEGLPIRRSKSRRGDLYLISEMRKRYGFEASAAQYELQLKKWQARKNFKEPEWKRILHIYDKVCAAGKFKCPTIYDGDHPIAESKILTARRHYAGGSANTQLCTDTEISLPERVDIREGLPETRDPSDVTEIQLGDDIRPISLYTGGLVLSSNWPTEELNLPPWASETEDPDLNLQIISMRNSPPADRPLPTRIPSPFSWTTPQYPSSPFHFTGYDNIAPLPPDLFTHYPIDLSFPECSNMEMSWDTPDTVTYALNVDEFGSFDGRGRNLSLEGSSLTLDAPSNVPSIETPLPVQGYLLPLQAIITHIRDFLPDDLGLNSTDGFNTHLDVAPTLNSSVSNPEAARCLIWSISNGYAGLEDTQPGLILNTLRQSRSVGPLLFQQLKTDKGLDSKALAENLFQAAIESSDAEAVQQLLATELIAPNDLVFVVNGKRYTPLERAALLESVDITRILLEAGADTNKGHTSLPLRLAIPNARDVTAAERPKRTNIELINILLRHKAKVNRGMVLESIKLRDCGLLDLLLPEMSECSLIGTEHDCNSIADAAVKSLDCDQAAKVVQRVVNGCLGTACGCLKKSSLEDSNKTQLDRLLILSTERGIFKLAKFLLCHTSQRDAALCAAVRSGSRPLFDLLLRNGARVNCPAVRYENRAMRLSFYYTSPLAEAIRRKDTELIEFIEGQEALLHLETDRGLFEAASCAAAEVGDFGYTEMLLNRASEMTRSGDALLPALEAALQNGPSHDAITWLLLERGASSSPGVLIAALEIKSEEILDMILESHWKENPRYYPNFWGAIAKWLSPHIIRKLASVPMRWLSPNYPLPILETEKALAIIAEQGNSAAAEALIQLQPRLADTLLPAAVAINNIDMVKILFDKGANSANIKAFQKAVSASAEMLRILLERFQHQYPKGKQGFGAEALREAIEDDKNPQILDALLQAKFDYNSFVWKEEMRGVSDFESWSPLGIAILKSGSSGLENIQKLVDAGSGPNAIVMQKSSYSQTALLLAIETRSVEVVTYLVVAGAKVNKEPRLGVRHTPLQKACKTGNYQMVQLLLGLGALVNAPAARADGGTALQCAAMSGSVRISQLLINNGARLEDPPSISNGRSPLEAAAEHGRLDMLRFICDKAKPKGLLDKKDMDRAMALAGKNGYMACQQYLQSISSSFFNGASQMRLTYEGDF